MSDSSLACEEEKDEISSLVYFAPGPLPMSSAAALAMSKPLIAPRVPEFKKVIQSVREKLFDRIFSKSESEYDFEKWELPIPIVGSGTTAVEAMLRSFCRIDIGISKVCVISNGFFGERWIKAISRMTEIDGKHLKLSWGQSFSLEKIKIHFIENNINAVVIVANETSTGLLNPIEQVSTLASSLGIFCFIDAVSAVGVHTKNGVSTFTPVGDAFAFGANKGLRGPTGIGFVCIKKKLLLNAKSATATVQQPPLSLDIISAALALKNDGYCIFTPNMSAFYALDVILNEPSSIPAFTPQEISQLFLCEPFFSDVLQTQQQSPFIVTLRSPSLSFPSYLSNKGFVVHPGKGLLKGSAFQICLLSPALLESETVTRLNLACIRNEPSCLPIPTQLIFSEGGTIDIPDTEMVMITLPHALKTFKPVFPFELPNMLHVTLFTWDKTQSSKSHILNPLGCDWNEVNGILVIPQNCKILRGNFIWVQFIALLDKMAEKGEIFYYHHV